MGGGLIQDMLPHPLNAVEWLAGPATRVVADAAHAVLPGVAVEDTVHVLARHGEVLASYSLNQHQPVNEFTVTVHGDRGSVRWEFRRQRWLSADRPDGEWTEEAAYRHERDDLYRMQAEHFLDYLEGRAAEPPCSLADGIRTLRSTLAVLASVERGTWREVEA
jgi:predicted dehydrogenase